MVFLEEVNKLSFIANLFDTPHYGCAGILDLEEKQILWIDDLATSSSDTHIAPKQPAFESGDKLYVKDFNDTLHIYQREWHLRPRAYKAPTGSAADATEPWRFGKRGEGRGYASSSMN